MNDDDDSDSNASSSSDEDEKMAETENIKKALEEIDKVDKNNVGGTL